MATTDATRRADSISSPTAAPRAPEQIESAIVTSPVQVGIEWGYPISFIRRLGIAFAVLLLAGFAAARVLDEPGRELEVLLHILPVAASMTRHRLPV